MQPLGEETMRNMLNELEQQKKKYCNLVTFFEKLGDNQSKEIFSIRYRYLQSKDKRKYMDEILETQDTWKLIQFDEFVGERKEKPIVIFGAGYEGQYTYRLLKKCGYQIERFLDNRQVGNIYGIPIVTPSHYSSVKKENKPIVVLASSKYALEFYYQLLSQGFSYQNIYVPILATMAGYTGKQYFDLPFIHPVKKNIFIDAGAYNGSSSLDFIEWCEGKYNQIYVFEPDCDNIKKCEKMFAEKACRNIALINKGVWDEETVLHFSNRGKASARISDTGDEECFVTSIDTILGSDDVSFIKMDVEGAELRALKGARKAIERCKPALAISIYHKLEDIIEIPTYLMEIMPEYTFYIRQYQTAYETILYAVIK